jgi:hypothetical protein
LGAGGFLVIALARSIAGAIVPFMELRPLLPGRLTMAEHRRLLSRWDLSEPERASRVRELFLATAGDSSLKRLRLAYDVVVPPPAEVSGTSAGTLRRVTVDTVSRVAGKMGQHGEDHTGIEYDEVGNQVSGRADYLASVEGLSRRASDRTR